MKTYIELIQDWTAKRGLPQFTAIVGNSEATARQLLALTHEVVEDMQMKEWPGQLTRKEWAGLAAEDQGAFETLFPGFRSLVPDSLWNVTQRRPIPGSMHNGDYQYFKGMGIAGPITNYKVLGDRLMLVPALAATDTLSALYYTKYVVKDSLGAPKERLTSDTDTFIFPDNVFKLSLDWRWRRDRGESWLPQQLEAKDAIAKSLDTTTAAPELNLTPKEYAIKPGIWIPSGSWPL